MSDRAWTQLEAEVIDRLLHAERHPLADAPAPVKPGIYAMFFASIPDPCLDHPDMRRARWPCYIGVSDQSVGARLSEHRLGLQPVRSLSAETFLVATVDLPSASAARFAECLALAMFKPVYATVLKGFGSKPQGSKRLNQARSPFSVLHPGRPGPCGPPKLSKPELRVKVREHLAATVALGGAWPPARP